MYLNSLQFVFSKFKDEFTEGIIKFPIQDVYNLTFELQDSHLLEQTLLCDAQLERTAEDNTNTIMPELSKLG